MSNQSKSSPIQSVAHPLPDFPAGGTDLHAVTDQEAEPTISIQVVTLSDSERILMKLLAEDGLTVKEIAAKVNPNKRTIEKKIENLRIRFKCLNVRQLVWKVTKEGLIA